MGNLIYSIGEGLFLAMLVFYMQRKQNKKDKKHDEREKARKKESLLQMELIMAGNKLSYATAMAIKRGTPNGEVEEGLKAYEQASKNYRSFINEQAKEYLD